jgi:hypothetical protein
MDFEVEHVAIVSYPFNKRARITEIRQHGKWKDHMTCKERRCPNRAERTPSKAGKLSVEWK